MGPQEAGKEPELAVLSAMAHRHEEELAPAMMEAVVTSARGLDEESFRFYVDLALSMMSGSARKALEAMMRSSGYQYQSAIAREFVAQGHQQGRLEGERSALLKVLDARGLTVDDSAREKLLACTDLEQLERWICEAAVATSVHDLFKRRRASKSTARTVAKRSRSVKPARPRAKR